MNFDGFNWKWPIFGRILLIDERPNAVPADFNGDGDVAKLPLLLTGCGKLKIEMENNVIDLTSSNYSNLCKNGVRAQTWHVLPKCIS